MDEVAGLPPILVDDRSVACRYLQGKVLGHARVRIRNRLARADNIEIAKHRNGNPIRTADGQKQLFLSAFRDGVDTLWRKGLPFIGRKGLEGQGARYAAISLGTRQFPFAMSDLLGQTQEWKGHTVSLARVFSFAIDGYRRGQNHLADRVTRIREDLEQVRGAL